MYLALKDDHRWQTPSGRRYALIAYIFKIDLDIDGSYFALYETGIVHFL
jgi:hypothetical protein